MINNRLFSAALNSVVGRKSYYPIAQIAGKSLPFFWGALQVAVNDFKQLVFNI